MSTIDIVPIICDNGRVINVNGDWSVESSFQAINFNYYKRGCRLVDGDGNPAISDQKVGSLKQPIRLTGGTILTNWQGNRLFIQVIFLSTLSSLPCA